MTDQSAIFISNTTTAPCGTTRWMSPELLDTVRFGSDGRPSRESDCYALGITIYEVSAFHTLEPSHLPISRYSVVFCLSITCGLPWLPVRCLEGSVQESLRTPCRSVSLTRCGDCYSCVGMSRPRRDPLLGSYWTISVRLPVLGYLQNYVPPQGELSVPVARIPWEFPERPCLVRCV